MGDDGRDVELQYPGDVTIVLSRYRGIYEPGLWLVLPCAPDALPSDWNSDDVTCGAFFALRRDIGGGDTPDAAYRDLLRRQAVCRGERPSSE